MYKIILKIVLHLLVGWIVAYLWLHFFIYANNNIAPTGRIVLLVIMSCITLVVWVRVFVYISSVTLGLIFRFKESIGADQDESNNKQMIRKRLLDAGKARKGVLFLRPFATDVSFQIGANGDGLQQYVIQALKSQGPIIRLGKRRYYSRNIQESSEEEWFADFIQLAEVANSILIYLLDYKGIFRETQWILNEGFHEKCVFLAFPSSTLRNPLLENVLSGLRDEPHHLREIHDVNTKISAMPENNSKIESPTPEETTLNTILYCLSQSGSIERRISLAPHPTQEEFLEAFLSLRSSAE